MSARVSISETVVYSEEDIDEGRKNESKVNMSYLFELIAKQGDGFEIANAFGGKP